MTTLPLLTEQDYETLDILRTGEKFILWQIDFGGHPPRVKAEYVAKLAAKREEIREVYEGRKSQAA